MSLTRITGNVVQDYTIPESKLINPYVNVSGDTMTGTLVLPANGLVAGTNQLVLSGGYVGINNLNPSYNLDVNGSLRVTGQFIATSILSSPRISLVSDGSSGAPAVFFNNENNTGIYRSTTGTINLTSTGNDSLSVSSTLLKNFSGIYSVSRSGSINSTDNAIEYNSGIDTYYFGRDAVALNFRTYGVGNRITVNSVGQVGIGTANTIANILLNVAGRVNAASGYAGILLSDLPTITIPYGGTGITSYSSGDILYYSSGNTFSRLSSPPQESLLLITAGGVPYWSPRPLAVAHGGSGLTILPANGQLLIGNGTSYNLNTISAGVGVSVVNGAGSIGIGVTNIPNASLTNSSLIINTGNGLSGGGSVGLGSSITLVSTGVTSIAAGTAISVSGATGAVTINNTGVTSASAGSGLTVTAATGSVKYSLDPNYAPNFPSISLSTPLAIPSGGTGLATTPTLGQVLYGNGTSSYAQLQLVGVGVTITPDFVAKTLTLTANLSGASVSILSNGNSSVNIPTPNGTIIATTANTERLRLDTSGNIGIGTTTPSSKIDFGTSQYQNKRIIGLITQTNNFAGIGLSPDSPAGVVITGTSPTISNPGEVASIGYYSNDGNYNLTRVVYVRNDGKVAIGNNTSPAYSLDVTGDVNSSSTVRIGGTTQVIGVTDTVTSSTGQATIDSFSSTTYRSAKYVIQILNTDNTYYQVSEVLVIHNGTNAYITEYGIINTGTSLGVIDANVSGGNVNLLLTPTYPNNKIRVSKTILGIQ